MGLLRESVSGAQGGACGLRLSKTTEQPETDRDLDHFPDPAPLVEMWLPAITLGGQRKSWPICGSAAELFGRQYARRLAATGVEAVSFELRGDLNL